MHDNDQRKEPRIRSRGRVNLLADGADAVSATIHDVAPSGISVVAESEISVDTPVQIDGDGFTGHGVVRYCRRHGQTYRLGVELEPLAAI
jgi:hypothetical protein